MKPFNYISKTDTYLITSIVSNYEIILFRILHISLKYLHVTDLSKLKNFSNPFIFKHILNFKHFM